VAELCAHRMEAGEKKGKKLSKRGGDKPPREWREKAKNSLEWGGGREEREEKTLPKVVWIMV